MTCIHWPFVTPLGFRISLAVCLAVVCSSLLQAQVSTTGKIAGVVTDASGASVANASITVKGSALMADRTSPAQADGSYLFDLLPLARTR